MKRFKFLAFMLVIVASVSVLVSCSKNDDKPSAESLIVGTWREGNGRLLFNKDKTYEWDYNYYIGEHRYGSKGTYQITNHTIKLSEISSTWTILVLDKETFTYMYPDGEIRTFIRQK